MAFAYQVNEKSKFYEIRIGKLNKRCNNKYNLWNQLIIMGVLQILKEHEILIKDKFGVKRIGIFGSFARGKEKAGSDIDVLVEFDETKITFDNYMDLKFYLEDLFKREVDLVIESSIKPRLKDNIMREVVYA